MGDDLDLESIGAVTLRGIQALALASNELHEMLISTTSEGRPPDPDRWQMLASSIGVQVGDVRRASAQISELLGLGSAQDRLIRYLRLRVGEVVTGDQLAGVAGIAAWARRIRELRVEHGWPIESGVQRPGLASDQYVLVSSAPDTQLAASWRLAKQIRNHDDVSGKARLLEYLQAVSPRPADQDQLDYVAKIKSWQRRMRELDEEGWEIRSNVDEPNLAPGTYRLASLDPRPPKARRAIALRYEILERDSFTCQDCQSRRGQIGIRLEVHHRVWVSRSGDNDPDNLVTLCDGCHAGRHSVERGRTDDELRQPGVEANYSL